MPVFFRENDLLDRNTPVDTEGRIVPGDGAFMLGRIEIIAFVLEDHLVSQYAEAVGKASWNKKLEVILARQFYGYVLSEGRRSLTDVYGHIEHGTLNDPYQFALGKRRFLEV